VAALQVLAVIVEQGRPASEVCRVFTPLPQLLRNVRCSGGSPLGDRRVTEAVAEAEAVLNGSGRLLIRESGTEPVIRVMAEAEDDRLVQRVVDELCETIAEIARSPEDAL
jgi:phosphoglucosamine mutase